MFIFDYYPILIVISFLLLWATHCFVSPIPWKHAALLAIGFPLVIVLFTNFIVGAACIGLFFGVTPVISLLILAGVCILISSIL